MRILCIFAHPDDETFGPGGTVALWASQGAEIHLLCATCGQAGRNDSDQDTAQRRMAELQRASQILGVQQVEFLDFEDGTLGNRDLKRLEEIITQKIEEFQPDRLLTFDLNGLSGHLDHIAVSSATTQAFRKTNSAAELYYFTLPFDCTMMSRDYFVYFPVGASTVEIDVRVDVSSVWPQRIEALHAHESQAEDCSKVEETLKVLGKREYFWVRKQGDEEFRR